MTALTTPTDEWFVQDLRGPKATLDDESVVEFRRGAGGAAARFAWIGAGLLLLAVLVLAGSGTEPEPTRAPAAAPSAAGSDPGGYEADWESAVEEQDPAFVVERRVIPMEPSPTE